MKAKSPGDFKCLILALVFESMKAEGVTGFSFNVDDGSLTFILRRGAYYHARAFDHLQVESLRIGPEVLAASIVEGMVAGFRRAEEHQP